MRLPRFRLRTLMISIAFLALISTVLVQQYLLGRAAAREELVRATVEHERALAETAARQAQAQLEQLKQRHKAR